MRDLFGGIQNPKKQIQGDQYIVSVIQETPGDSGAYLVNDGEHNFWLPKSQIQLIDDREVASAGTHHLRRMISVIIPDWLAEKEGLTA